MNGIYGSPYDSEMRAQLARKASNSPPAKLLRMARHSDIAIKVIKYDGGYGHAKTPSTDSSGSPSSQESSSSQDSVSSSSSQDSVYHSPNGSPNPNEKDTLLWKKAEHKKDDQKGPTLAELLGFSSPSKSKKE